VEYVACDLCGSDETRLVYRVRDTNYGTPGEFHLVQCRTCQLVYLNPRPAPSRYFDIYPETTYDPFDEMNRADEPKPNETHRERARQLTRMVGSGRVLDVGCGTGLFLQAMREEGWSCVGVEPSPRASEFARTRLRLDVRQGTIFDIADTESFDVITFWDALEHTPSPRAALGRVHQLLIPRGIIALSLPNWDSVERRIFGAEWIALDAPRHFYHFSPSTIRRLLASSGFHVQTIQARAPVMSLASNILRWGGRWILRRGKAKGAPALNVPTRRTPSLGRRWMIRATYLGVTPLNALINSIHRGADLMVIARKV